MRDLEVRQLTFALFSNHQPEERLILQDLRCSCARRMCADQLCTW